MRRIIRAILTWTGGIRNPIVGVRLCTFTFLTQLARLGLALFKTLI
jgi:hypothetical protein